MPERELFPGVMPLVLGAIGAAPPMSLATMALVAGTAVAFDGSLGTNGLIYGPLYRYALPFRGMRVPARFGALVGTGLVLLAGYGATRLLRLGRHGSSRAAIFAILAAASLWDVRIWLPIQPYPLTIPPIYSAVTSDMVLAEVPIRNANIAYMYFSTFHWARLINGYSGYVPESFQGLESAMDDFPTPDLVHRLRAMGATHITVNCRFMHPDRCAATLEGLDNMDDLKVIAKGRWQGAEVRLYRFTQ